MLYMCFVMFALSGLILTGAINKNAEAARRLEEVRQIQTHILLVRRK